MQKIARLVRNRVAKNMLVEGMTGGLIPVFCFGFGGDIAVGFFRFGRFDGFVGQAAELLQIGVVDPIFHFEKRFFRARRVSIGIPISSSLSSPCVSMPLCLPRRVLCFVKSFSPNSRCLSRECACRHRVRARNSHARKWRCRISSSRCRACPAALSHFFAIAIAAMVQIAPHEQFRLCVLALDFCHDGRPFFFVPNIHFSASSANLYQKNCRRCLSIAKKV